MIDIGANLTHESFDKDRAQVVEDAKHAGVKQFVITGSNADCSLQARELAHLYKDCCYATAGVHPHHASEFNAETDALIRELITDEKVVAVGETGLDYFRDISPRPAQIFSFEQHINIARESQLPLFLHQRDAHKDFFPIIKEHRHSLNRVLVHCFTDSEKALFDYLDQDCYIGITGWICDERRGKHLIELVKNIPINRLLLETDSPYLIPRNLKPKPKTRRNEPRHLPHIGKFVAEILGLPFSELADQTVQNSQDFFQI